MGYQVLDWGGEQDRQGEMAVAWKEEQASRLSPPTGQIQYARELDRYSYSLHTYH